MVLFNLKKKRFVVDNFGNLLLKGAYIRVDEINISDEELIVLNKRFSKSKANRMVTAMPDKSLIIAKFGNGGNFAIYGHFNAVIGRDGENLRAKYLKYDEENNTWSIIDTTTPLPALGTNEEYIVIYTPIWKQVQLGTIKATYDLSKDDIYNLLSMVNSPTNISVENIIPITVLFRDCELLIGTLINKKPKTILI